MPLERASQPSRRGASSEDVEELQEEVLVREEEKHDGQCSGDVPFAKALYKRKSSGAY